MERVRVDDRALRLGYEGTLIRPGIAEFRGIPYAERPDWGRPLPAPLRRTVDATGLAPVPPQPGVAEEETGPGSYLTLTVRAPWPSDRPRPVLVWLCVAGNVVGRHDVPPFSHSTLADAGIVTVMVAGRLGAQGFAVLPDAPDDRAALDWIAALHWVRERIGAFGGDAGAVTVGGQSAGGGAVAALLASTAATGLFQRAVVMSTATPSTDRAAARRATEDFAGRLGSDATAAALGRVPTDRLLAGVAEAFGPRWRVDDPVQRVRNMVEGPPFRLVDEPALGIGPLLPALAAGAGSSVAVLAGSTAQEFTEAFAAMPVEAADLSAALDAVSAGGARHLEHYRKRVEGPPGAILGQAFTDAVFRRTPRRMALARAAAGAADTWLYDVGPFDRGPSARHGVDVAAALGAPDGGLPQRAADAVTAALTRFVLTGAPGWDRWGDHHLVRRFGDGGDDAGAELDELAGLWDGRD